MKNIYDLLKVLAILLVVIGHITILYKGNSFGIHENIFLSYVSSSIYLFHMPLFIALSGSIYQIGIEAGKYVKFRSFLINKIFRLYIPFIIVGSLFLAPTLILLGMSKDISFIQTVYNIVGCLGEEKHLWYLPALFWIFIITWCVKKANINIYIAFLVSVILALLRTLFIDFNFLCLSNAIYYLPYFLFGMIIQINIDKVDNNKVFFYSLLFMFSIGFAIKVTSIVWLDNLLSILFPCTFIAILLPISKLIYPFVKENRLMKFLLNKSFSIYLFHVMIIYFIYSAFGRILPTILIIFFAFFSSIVVSVFIAFILSKLNLQIILGEK